MTQARLFVVALRRSGSTIFWSLLRQDRRFRAYNEPFNPLIRRLGDEAWMSRERRHYAEYESLLTKCQSVFWDRFDAIYEIQELQNGLTDRQHAYLRFLLADHENTIVETTRCHFKLADLRREGGDRAVLVHLYRSPEGFATSHLLPSTTNARRVDVPDATRAVMIARAKVRRAMLRRRFWTRERGYDHWGLETLIGEGLSSPFFSRLAALGLDPTAIHRMPAVGRLLAYWRVAFSKVEREGRELFGDRFFSVNLERWCRNPRPALVGMYEALDLPLPSFDFSSLRRPGRAFDSTNPRWAEYRATLGLDALLGTRVDDADDALTGAHA